MKEKILEVIELRAKQGWLMIDQDYKVVYANESICQWLSQEQSDFIGSSLQDAMRIEKRPSLCGQLHSPLIETLAVGKELTRQECYLSVRGQNQWFLANTYLLFDETGKSEYVLADYINIDKYKQIEKKLDNINFDIVKSFTEALGARDAYTKTHSEGVAELLTQLAQHMQLGPQSICRVHLAGLVHDVGKLGIPEHILNKPGRLTAEEFAVIQQHPVIGARILANINGFEDIAQAVRHHHECFDGSGYPDGLSGQDIPLFSRMLSVCDTFDAMIHARCYRYPYSRREAIEEINRCAGSQFDPVISAAFIEMLDYGKSTKEMKI